MDNIRAIGKLITIFPVRVLAETEYRQSSMESDDDKTQEDPEKEQFLESIVD
jgi:hypothetical protein